MTEQELILSVKKGDRNAFDKLYEIHWANLVSYSSLIAGGEHAKDIVHDVFLKVWLNRTNLQEKETLRPYLMRSVYHMSLNVLRKNANMEFTETCVDNQIDFLAAGEYNPDSSEIIKKLYAKDTAEQIHKAMEMLPERCREIFRKSYLEGQSHREIALELGLSVSTVDNQIYKALKLMREKLGEGLYLILLWLTIH
ncbi:MAG: RNA polymerase sigma-70 factor [Bacteroidales bacterium]|nr:RNA polymerase sigma-70 factor [Bacteroidales bacterium]